LLETNMARTLLLGLAALVAALCAAPQASQAGNRYGSDFFPNVPVVDQDGKTLNFYDDVIKGKIVVISFIFTSCTDLCPLTTARIAQVVDKLGDKVGRDVFFVSLSVDPEHDTPEKMKLFADAFEAPAGWKFLTGKPEDMKAITYKLGDRSRDLSEHRNEIVLGNDRTGDWQRDSVLGEIDRVMLTIRSMDPAYRDEVREVKSYGDAINTGLAMGGQPGQAMFKKLCAPCHTIGVGDHVGPDLRDVSSRHDHQWLSKFIQDPQRMLRAQDPQALALAARFPGVQMPSFGVTEIDAEDLIAFLDAETKRLSEVRKSAAAAEEPHIHRH
jgi:protein SCO1